MSDPTYNTDQSNLHISADALKDFRERHGTPLEQVLLAGGFIAVWDDAEREITNILLNVPEFGERQLATLRRISDFPSDGSFLVFYGSDRGGLWSVSFGLEGDKLLEGEDQLTVENVVALPFSIARAAVKALRREVPHLDHLSDKDGEQCAVEVTLRVLEG